MGWIYKGNSITELKDMPKGLSVLFTKLQTEKLVSITLERKMYYLPEKEILVKKKLLF